MRCLFLVILFLCTHAGQAQSKKKLSRQQFVKDSIWIMRVKTVRPQVRIDDKVTFFEGDRLNINGFDAGVMIKEKLRCALGYYYMTEELSTYDKNINGRLLGRKLRLNYMSANVEYIFLNTRFFSLGVPFEFGFGKNELQYYEINDERKRRQFKGNITLADLGFSATFKPIRWVGLRTVIGYRKSISNQIPDFKFDGLFGSAGVGINIREVSKDVQMYLLKRKYHRLGKNSLETAIDLMED